MPCNIDAADDHPSLRGFAISQACVLRVCHYALAYRHMPAACETAVIPG